MPWDNVPESMWPKMEDCVQKVMAEGKDKEAATAICYTSIMGKEAGARKGLWEQVKDALGSLFPVSSSKEADMSADKAISTKGGVLFLFEQKDAPTRWVAITSNAFQDRDHEILAQAALEADVARADKDQDYGPLRWWHVGIPDLVAMTAGPGLDLGVCDFNAMEGRMLVESGTFAREEIAAAVKTHAAELELSTGFFHPLTEPDEQGVYHQVRRFERSLVPAGRASNPFTALAVTGGENAMMKEKVDELLKLLGGNKAAVEAVQAQAGQLEEKALKAGVAYKAEPPPAEAPEVKADPPPAEPAPEEKPAAAPTLADLSVDEFAALLAKAVAAGVQAAMGGQAAEMESKSKEIAEAAETKFKATATTMVELAKGMDAIVLQQKTLTDAVKRLEGDLPRAQARASQDPATVVQKDLTKEGPRADPVADALAQGAGTGHPLATFISSFVRGGDPAAKIPDGSR